METSLGHPTAQRRASYRVRLCCLRLGPDLKSSKDRDSTAYRAYVVHCLIVLMRKMFFLISALKLPCLNVHL